MSRASVLFAKMGVASIVPLPTRASHCSLDSKLPGSGTEETQHAGSEVAA